MIGIDISTAKITHTSRISVRLTVFAGSDHDTYRDRTAVCDLNGVIDHATIRQTLIWLNTPI